MNEGLGELRCRRHFLVIKQPFCLKMLLFVRWYDKLFLDATIDGRRLPPLEISEFISIFYKIVVKKRLVLCIIHTYYISYSFLQLTLCILHITTLSNS